MRSIQVAAVILVLCIAMRRAGEELSSEAIQTRISSIFAPLVQPNEPGLAVVLKKDGKILFVQGYGVRQLGFPAKIDLETNFRLASCTKQFTAMAIMLLVHDGKLHYEDRLSMFFPDFPPYGKDITVRELLSHTSGLPDYAEIMEKEEKNGAANKWSPEHQIQDEEVLTLLKGQPVGKFEPGTRWEYSNSGYVVLGLIVERVSRMPYRDFLEQRIFGRLKMNHTIVYQKGTNTVSDRAFGHSKENDKFVETDQSPTSATLGDGGIYSNVMDLAKWDEGLQKHTLLSESEMQAALTPVHLADGSEPHWPRDPQAGSSSEPPAVMYGFGWFLDPYQGHARNYHDGGTMGFRTTIQRFINDHFTVIVLCNRTDLNPDQLSLKAADLLLATN